jgi:hypothetical protein
MATFFRVFLVKWLLHSVASQAPTLSRAVKGSCGPFTVNLLRGENGLLRTANYENGRPSSDAVFTVNDDHYKIACASPGLVTGTYSSVTAIVRFSCSGSRCPPTSTLFFEFVCQASTHGNFVFITRNVIRPPSSAEDVIFFPTAGPGRCGVCTAALARTTTTGCSCKL